MYVTRVEIRNIRSIKHLVWEIDNTIAPGWHVILGDNGSGKSSILKSIALNLMHNREVAGLRQDWRSWINSDYLRLSNIEQYIKLSGSEETARQSFGDAHKAFECSVIVHFDDLNKNNELGSLRGLRIAPFMIVDGNRVGAFYLTRSFDHNDSHLQDGRLTDSDPSKEVDLDYNGFASSFGPFRRFSGGVKDNERLFEVSPRLALHLSVFGEQFALPEGLKWLQQQRFKALEHDANAELLLDNLKGFVNQIDFLPFGARMTEVSSEGVKFLDGNGSEIYVEEMSDGYRSVLSLTFELLRQLSLSYGPDMFEAQEDGKVTVKVPGVVQIDEVDAHLHPTWQKRIGFWFREHFPQMQFIVTTHSPLVCQAAEKGSIFLLPRPGTEETGRMLEGTERDRLIYGDILDAYSTEAFGGGETRSPKGQELLDLLGELNVKEMLHGLTPEEQKEQERLRAAMPSAATAEPK